MIAGSNSDIGKKVKVGGGIKVDSFDTLTVDADGIPIEQADVRKVLGHDARNFRGTPGNIGDLSHVSPRLHAGGTVVDDRTHELV